MEVTHYMLVVGSSAHHKWLPESREAQQQLGIDDVRVLDFTPLIQAVIVRKDSISQVLDLIRQSAAWHLDRLRAERMLEDGREVLARRGSRNGITHLPCVYYHAA